MVAIKDRITGLRRIKASELLPNPRNWRTHPKAQQEALRGILAEDGDLKPWERIRVLAGED